MKSALLGALGALAISGAANAAIVTVDVSQGFNTSNQPFTEFYQNVFLPGDATNVKLNIVQAVVDDAAVVQVNGSNLFGFGIFGPGDGYFHFTSGGPAEQFHFDYSGRGGDPGPFADGVSFSTSSFLLGQNNVLHIIVNDTNNGINNNGPLQTGPTQLIFNANISYETGAVPEPATWGLMIAGFGLAGAALRRRNAAQAIVRA